MTILNWYAVGSCSVTNNNPVVTGTATSWLQNVDPREGFRGPDGLIYEIASIDSDTQLTLATNYKGVSSGGGLPYSICPLTGYERSLAADAASLLTKAGALLNQAPTTLDILQYRGTTWVTRSLSQYALDLYTGPAEVNVAAASTCDIGAATSHRVAITGASTTINSLGTTFNCVRLVRFTGILTVTHNATSLILPGGVDITTAVGDTGTFVSDGAGNWRCTSYTSPRWHSAKFGIGMVAVNVFDVTQSGSNAPAVAMLLNSNGGNAATAEYKLSNGTSISTLKLLGNGYTDAGIFKHDATMLLAAGANGLVIGTSVAQPVIVAIDNSEIMRVNGTGVLIEATAQLGNERLRVKQSAANDCTFFENSNAAPGSSSVVDSVFTGAAPNNSTAFFLYCSDNATLRCGIYSNGGIANYQANNVNLSDEGVKDVRESLRPMIPALWDAHKSIEWGRYKYNDQTHDDWNYGPTAQEVQRAFKEIVPAIVDFWDKEEKLLAICTHDLQNITAAIVSEAQRRVDDHEARLRKLEAA